MNCKTSSSLSGYSMEDVNDYIGLRVRQVDFKGRTIRLDPGTTKNGEGREVTMTARLEDLLRRAVKGKVVDDYVLTRKGGGPVRDFRREWKAVTKRAGLAKLLVHDLRRSAAKAMRKAGVAESVIMATGGWRTASMFRRYAIVSPADQRDAMEKLEADRARMDRAEAGKLTENGPVLSPFLPTQGGKLQ
jgi:integrase